MKTYAYIKGQSVDSALHSVIQHIERYLSFQEYTLATFLNIEGDFNNTVLDAVMAALKGLKDRVLKVVAYADDIVIMTSCKFRETLADILEGALNAISTWALKCGLNVNTNKTEIVLYTMNTLQ